MVFSPLSPSISNDQQGGRKKQKREIPQDHYLSQQKRGMILGREMGFLGGRKDRWPCSDKTIRLKTSTVKRGRGGLVRKKRKKDNPNQHRLKEKGGRSSSDEAQSRLQGRKRNPDAGMRHILLRGESPAGKVFFLRKIPIFFLRHERMVPIPSQMILFPPGKRFTPSTSWKEKAVPFSLSVK